MMCEHKKESHLARFFAVETKSKTVLSIKTCQVLRTIKVLAETTEAQQSAPEKRSTRQYSMADHHNLKEKIEKIKDKYGKELKEDIEKMYPREFNGLGKLEPTHHMEIETDAIPIVNPPRKIPVTLRKMVKKELV